MRKQNKQVEKGTPIVFICGQVGSVDVYAKNLDKQEIIEYQEFVGEARQSWMGSWVFTKPHPVFEGLPVGSGMNQYYQVGAMEANGIVAEGKGMEVFAGYSRDHDSDIGAAAFEVPYGKGKVLYFSLYGLSPQKEGELPNMQEVVRKKLWANIMEYAMKKKS